MTEYKTYGEFAVAVGNAVREKRLDGQNPNGSHPMSEQEYAAPVPYWETEPEPEPEGGAPAPPKTCRAGMVAYFADGEVVLPCTCPGGVHAPSNARHGQQQPATQKNEPEFAEPVPYWET